MRSRTPTVSNTSVFNTDCQPTQQNLPNLVDEEGIEPSQGLDPVQIYSLPPLNQYRPLILYNTLLIYPFFSQVSLLDIYVYTDQQNVPQGGLSQHKLSFNAVYVYTMPLLHDAGLAVSGCSTGLPGYR